MKTFNFLYWAYSQQRIMPIGFNRASR